MKRKVPIINSKTWNAMIDELSRRPPLRFVRSSRRWLHPWTIMPEWSDIAGQWVFRIRPGFGNGVEPEISTTAMLATERTLDRIEEKNRNAPRQKPVREGSHHGVTSPPSISFHHRSSRQISRWMTPGPHS